jgi:hypothetical protein
VCRNWKPGFGGFGKRMFLIRYYTHTHALNDNTVVNSSRLSIVTLLWYDSSNTPHNSHTEN